MPTTKENLCSHGLNALLPLVAAVRAPHRAPYRAPPDTEVAGVVHGRAGHLAR